MIKMKRTEITESQKKKKRKNWKVILISLGLALVLLAIISLIKFGTVFFFIPFWFWAVDKIVGLTGVNIWLVRGFVSLLIIPFFYVIKLMFSWKAKRRRVGRILLSIIVASLCFSMFFLSEDIYFSFRTGQANKWYIITPEGEYKFSDSPGYDTLWGIRYQKVTTEVIRKYIRQEREEKVIGGPTSNREKKKAVPKKSKGLILSPEEEKSLVQELEKHLYPKSKKEVEKLYAIIGILEESNKLADHNDLLCAIAKKNLNRRKFWFNEISKNMVRYLGNIGAVESIPTLLWVATNADNPQLRKMSKKAIKPIKEGRKNFFRDQKKEKKKQELLLMFGAFGLACAFLGLLYFFDSFNRGNSDSKKQREEEEKEEEEEEKEEEKEEEEK